MTSDFQMTKLEEEMYQAINGSDWPPKLDSPLTDELRVMAITEAKAAASIANVYIQRAFDAGYARFRAEEYGAVPTKAPSKTDWLKSEGITE